VSKDSPKKAEQELLDNAAKRLDVTPQNLRDALSAAQDDQLDEAVKNGDLTQAQADKIKAHRTKLGTVLAPGGGGALLYGKHPGGRRLKMLHGFGLVSDLAKALDLSEKELLAKLRDGKSVANIAKAQGKSLDSVRSAIKAAARTRSDKAVEDGALTRKQADAMLEHLDERLEHLDKAPGKRFRGRDRLRHAVPVTPDMKPGGRRSRPQAHRRASATAKITMVSIPRR